MSYPTSVVAGELLLIIAAVDGNSDFSSVPSGFVTSLGSANDGGNIRQNVAKKLADGTESGSFNVTWGAAEQGCWRVLRIGPWDGTLGTNFTGGVDPNGGSCQGSSSFNAADSSAEFAAYGPGNWDSTAIDTLWLGVVAADGGDTVISSGAGSFTDEGTEQHSGGATGASLHVVYRQILSSSQAAPTATITPADEWLTRMFAIKGGTSGEAGTLAPSTRWMSAVGW